VKPGKGEFVGRAALERVRADGPARRLVGFEMIERGVARHGYPIQHGGRVVGHVTSGSYGPSVERYIGIGYVPVSLAAIGTELGVEIRGGVVPARVVKTPFHPTRVKR
jgi:aminomethyltransferase